MKQTQFSMIPCLALALLLGAASLQAAEVTNKWETSAAAGLSLTRGNSKTLLATVGINSKHKTPVDEILLGVAGAYGENTIKNSGGKEETQKTRESLSALGQYNRSFSEDWYGGVRVDFLHDEIADLKYRFTVSPLVGYYALKNPMTTLKFEAGPSGVFERQGTNDNQYAAIRLGERFEHKFNPKAKVWEAFDYIAQVDRIKKYLLIFEVGAEAALNEKFSLRATLQDNYENEPAPHRKNNDIKLITSLVYKF